MRRVRLSTGYELRLDGDILGLLEALYREVTLKRALQVSFEDMMRETQSLGEQMSEEKRRHYLVESLFLNSVTYENEMLDDYMRRLTGKKKGGRGRSAGGPACRGGCWPSSPWRCPPPSGARTHPPPRRRRRPPPA